MTTVPEPIEPDAVLKPLEYEDHRLRGSIAANEVDTSWLPDGFEVTRPSPPVGSFTFGMPGEGFFLVQPGEAAQFFPPGVASDQPPLSLDELVDQAQRAADLLGNDDEPTGLPDLGIVHDRTLD